MNKLNGTEKQIKYAADLYPQYTQAINDAIAKTQEIIDSYRGIPDCSAEIAAFQTRVTDFQSLRANIDLITDAGKMIALKDYILSSKLYTAGSQLRENFAHYFLGGEYFHVDR